MNSLQTPAARPTLEYSPITLASEALPKTEGVTSAAEKTIYRNADQGVMPLVTLTSIPVESSGEAVKTPANPIGIMETIGGTLQRKANLEKAIEAGALAIEPVDTNDFGSEGDSPEEKTEKATKIGQYVLYKLLIQSMSAIEVATIESGVLHTLGDYNSVLVITMPGEVTLDALQGRQFVFPNQPSVHIINPANRTFVEGTLEDTPFSASDMSLDIYAQGVKFPDRAVSIVHDKKTNMTFIGISRGVEFEREDVIKTFEDRLKGVDRRVAVNMMERLKEKGIINDEGKYKVITATGEEDWVPFNEQDPQIFLDPNFSRSLQIAEMELELFDRVEASRKELAVTE